MPTDEPTLGFACIGIAIAFALSAAVALGLRRLNVPGASILGGVCVGVLLGPLVLGRVAPPAFLQLFVGPVAQNEAAAIADRAVAAARLATTASSGDGTALIERSISDSVKAQGSWDEARRLHGRPRHLVLFVAGLLILATAFGRGARPRRPQGSDVVLAAWGVVVPGLLIAVFGFLLGDGAFSSATMLLAAVVSCGAWRISGAERVIARRCGRGSDHMAATSSWMASAAALILLAVALRDNLTVAAATVGLSLLALVLSWCGFPLRRQLSGLVLSLVIPGVSALLIIATDPLRDVSLVVLACIFLIAEDGRWLGSWLGTALGGFMSGASMRFALVGLGVAPMMVGFTALIAATGELPPGFVFSIVAAAFLLDSLGPARLRVAGRLEATSRPTDIVS